MERPEKYRRPMYMVCWKDSAMVSWKTKEEMEDLVLEEDVVWLFREGHKQISTEDLAFYKTYLQVKQEKGSSPTSKELAGRLGISRAEGRLTRRGVGQRLRFKGGS